MKLNLTVDFLIATATVILSILVFVDHCSARLRPMSSNSAASLSKSVHNLAADHLSALQQTSRKVTKSSIVGINWKNVLLLAGLKAGLVGAGLIKKKVAYKKIKGLKSLSGLDHLNGLNNYAYGYPMNSFNHLDGNAGPKFLPPNLPANLPPNFFDPSLVQYPPSAATPIQQINTDHDWSTKLPSPRSIDKYSIESYHSPIIWRKSSLCNDLNHCADYLTSSSITYQLLGTSLPLHFPVLLPASTKLTSTKISTSPKSSHHNQPFILTWVKSPSTDTGVGNLVNNEISNTISDTLSNSLNNDINKSKITNNLNNPPKQIVQEKDDDRYQHLEQPIYSTQFTTTNTSQYNTVQFKDNLQFKENSETPPEQLIENSNKISSWSA